MKFLKELMNENEIATIAVNTAFEIHTTLGWSPTATSFKELVRLMVVSDIRLAKKEETIKKNFD